MRGANRFGDHVTGKVALAPPIRFESNPFFAAPPGTPHRGVAELELHFAPEPAFAALLGAGALFLTWRALGLRARDA